MAPPGETPRRPRSIRTPGSTHWFYGDGTEDTHVHLIVNDDDQEVTCDWEIPAEMLAYLAAGARLRVALSAESVERDGVGEFRVRNLGLTVSSPHCSCDGRPGMSLDQLSDGKAGFSCSKCGAEHQPLTET